MKWSSFSARISGIAVASAALVASGTLGSAPASATTPGYPVVPAAYNPGHISGAVTAAWKTGYGETDAGTSDHGLVLDKNVPTATNAAAIATLERVNGTTWQDELGFDYAPGSYCSAGSPRFDVYDSTGTDHFFGCAYGTKTVLSDGWTQVRFTGADAFPQIAPDTSISAIYIVADEQGNSTLDNIYYDGATMGKPGA